MRRSEIYRYWVTRDGDIWSEPYSKRNTWYKMKPQVDFHGYLTFQGGGGGGRQGSSVHRSIAFAWIPNPKNHECVLHGNDIPDDNRIENLRWGDKASNAADRIVNGGHTWGVTHSTCKLTEEEVYEIRRRHDGGERCVLIAMDYPITPGHVNHIGIRARWKSLPERTYT